MGSVSGTVTLDGEPLSQVMVTFSPNDGQRESYGITNDSGQYQLRYTSQELGARTGKHEVRISPVGVEPKEPVSQNTTTVPGHYYGEDFLRREVDSGSNQIDLELSSTATPKTG